MKRLFLIILCSVAFGLGLLDAQEVSDSATIRFHQSKSVLDPGFGDNRARLDEMLARLRSYGSPDSALMLKGVRVVGSASPEGTVAINRILSEKRAESIFGYFADSVGLPDSLTSFTFVGRDWQGLRELVEADPAVPDRAEVLTLLDEIITEGDNGGRWDSGDLARLRQLGGGKSYAYMYSRLFPSLRASKLYVDYMRKPGYAGRGIIEILPAPLTIPVTEPTAFALRLSVPEEEPAKCCRPFYMGLKTNLLYDALAVPNISAEFYIGRNWSVVANWMYGWWDKDHLHRYWRIYGGDIALRRWFGRKAEEKPLTGHHIGVYGGIVTYDFEFGGRGWMGGLPGGTLWDRCNINAGIEYGYSLPIGRRLNLDFTIGIGYIGGKYYEYVPHDGHYVWQSTHRLNWVGPTKAEVSLVWLIGCDNYNRRKGGVR
ncbi:MAG: DUF3575 domain-containing protein [Duncaniella sp.]|nr:DUF3575 domain-containing protein [Duncaniella sp.]